MGISINLMDKNAMKVVLVNTNDSLGGAAKAALRLHKQLLDFLIDSTLFVQRKDTKYDNIVGPGSNFGKLYSMIKPHYEEKIVQTLYRKKRAGLFSIGYIHAPVTSRIDRLFPDADIVNLHWINGNFINIRDLPRIGKPIVWTLHDSWPFTGGCHLPYECNRYTECCGKCPALGSHLLHDLSQRSMNLKRKVFDSINLTIVAPSRWIAACAEKSSLFPRKRIVHIPNGIDLSIFSDNNRIVSRKILNLNFEKKYILFGASSALVDPNKGYSLFIEAINDFASQNNDFAKNYEVLILGGYKSQDNAGCRLPRRYLGDIHDEITLSLVYSVADVFVCPSRSENLSFTSMEAIACGTPVVAFNIGGNGDIVQHQQTGYLAEPFSPKSLAEGIFWTLESSSSRWDYLSKKARNWAERNFDIKATTGKYIGLFNELLNK